MESRLGYSVIRNFDYSQPFEEGIVNRGREEHQSAHILSKTCLDLFVPSSSCHLSTPKYKTDDKESPSDCKKDESGSTSDDGVNFGGKSEKHKSHKQTVIVDNGHHADASPNGSNKMDAVRNGVGSSASNHQHVPSTTCKTDAAEDETITHRGSSEKISKSRPPPLVVFAYGGGWRRGDKQTWRHYISRWETNPSLAALVARDRLYSNIGESFASRGFPCAVMSYPLTPTPFLIHLIEMAISLAYALAYNILAGLLFSFILKIGLLACSYSDTPVPVLSLTAAGIIIVQWITVAFMVSRELYIERRHHSNSRMSQKLPIFIAFAAVIITLSNVNIETLIEHEILALSISAITLIAAQCLIAYFRQTTSFNLGPKLVDGPKGQAECVARALRWLVDYGRSTGHFDHETIILMGHSAGGHLVSLVTLDHHYLEDAGLSPKIIKGVITLSAVHDLLSIKRPFFYQIYLRPAFGTNPAFWNTMSPIEYVKVLDQNENSICLSPSSSSVLQTSNYESVSSDAKSTSSSSLGSLSSLSSGITSSSSSTSPQSSSLASSSLSSSASLSSSSLSTSSPLQSTIPSAIPKPQPPLSPSFSSSSSSSSSSSPHPSISPPLSSSHISISSSSSPSSSPTVESLPSSSKSPSQQQAPSSTSSISQTPLPPHRPHFLIMSPAQDFIFMIEDADKMHSFLEENGYPTRRSIIQGCGHFNMVRKFGCPWYRYWTGVLKEDGGWDPNDGELECWEFVQQFWNKD